VTEQAREIPREHTWKPPAFEAHLPELLEKASREPQLFMEHRSPPQRTTVACALSEIKPAK